MLRSLFSAGAIFVLVLSMCLLPQTVAARRCPVKEPETLLSLYQNSDAIYIATFDKTVEGEVIEKNEDYTSIAINKHFTISSTLKGESRKFFILEDRDYRYQSLVVNVIPEAEASSTEQAGDGEESIEPESVEEDEEESQTELKSGDTLLLFIKNAEEGESARLTDYRDGIKKLPMEKIGVYEARIKDLNSIFSAKKISEQRILEWLIKCAEDPVTRWEGTFELLQSVREQKWRDEAAQRRKDRIASGLPVEDEPLEESAEEQKDEAGDAKFVNPQVFAKMLDANHKQTLANILLNFASADGMETANGKTEYIAGNRELIQLVAQWGDPRLVGFLLDQVRSGAKDPSDIAETMELIAGILDDEIVTAIVERFSDTAYEDDDDQIENEDEAEDEAVEVEPADGEVSRVEPVGDEPVPAKAEADAETAGQPVAKKVTYKELRSELLQKFLTECARAAAGEPAKAASSGR